MLWDTIKWGTTKKPRTLSVRAPPFLRPSNISDAAEGRLLEKEPSNLQAQSLSGLIEDRATRGESPLFDSGHLLMRSPRWIHRNGDRRRRRSSWCFAAHEPSKAGGAQIAPTNAFLMPSFSSCFRLLTIRTSPNEYFHLPSMSVRLSYEPQVGSGSFQ